MTDIGVVSSFVTEGLDTVGDSVSIYLGSVYALLDSAGRNKLSAAQLMTAKLDHVSFR